jgi:hypothetical protein
MADKPYPIGPWPAGINNVDDERAEVFENRGPESPAALRAALNVDISRLGDVRRRTGRTKLIELTSGHSLFSNGERLMLVDDDLMSLVDLNTNTLSPRAGTPGGQLSYAHAAGTTWFVGPRARGRLVGDAVYHWGLRQPVIESLAVTTGSLPEGTYLVAATVEADDIESGAMSPHTIDVPEGGGITVNMGDVDGRAEFINIYMSTTNGRDAYFLSKTAVGLPLSTIEAVPQSTDTLELYGMEPPPLGHIVRFFRGRALIAKDNEIYWSQPLAYHHFKIATDLQVFASPIRMLEPMPDGAYVGTADGVFWLSGDEPDTWSPTLLSRAAAPELRAARVPGQAFPSLDFSGEIVIWMGAKGFVAGLPGGRVTYLTEGRVAMDKSRLASLVYRENNGIRQVLMSARKREKATQFGAMDAADCEVIKASTPAQ